MAHASQATSLTGPGRDDVALTRRRYDRIAALYDVVEWPMELQARRFRHDLWARVGEGRILELGVGTGKNMPFYPAARSIRAVDISPNMIARARARAERTGARVELEIADVERLPFPEASFDVVIATFLFCSVPNPTLGLRDTLRVLRPGGQLLLLEHVLSERPRLRRVMRALDPILFHVWGAHIDRETVLAVRMAGFVDVIDTNLVLDIMKRIEARAPRAPNSSDHADGPLVA